MFAQQMNRYMQFWDEWIDTCSEMTKAHVRAWLIHLSQFMPPVYPFNQPYSWPYPPTRFENMPPPLKGGDVMTEIMRLGSESLKGLFDAVKEGKKVIDRQEQGKPSEALRDALEEYKENKEKNRDRDRNDIH